MTPQKQLQTILNRKIGSAVQEYLEGDWSKLPSLFTIPRSYFDAWADGIQLPYGRITNRKSCLDGVYVLQDPDGWVVFEQKDGVHVSGDRVYANYRQAKRAALSMEYLSPLQGIV